LDLESATRGFRLPWCEHQGSEDELSAVRELEAECPRSQEPVRTDLECLLLPGAPLSTYHHQIF
jgi:hypothetical protein